MKERPITLKDEEVRGFLSGKRKRLLRPTGLEFVNQHPEWWEVCKSPAGKEMTPMSMRQGREDFNAGVGFWAEKTKQNVVQWSLGEVGDRLWAREVHCFLPPLCPKPELREIYFRADCENPDEYKWITSLGMRREHSRLLLEIVSIAISRLWDLPLSVMRDEGVSIPLEARKDPDLLEKTIREGFAAIWDGRFESRAASSRYAPLYARNPWVWDLWVRRVL